MANAQCPLTKISNDITIDMPGQQCTVSLAPDDFLTNMGTATATTNYTLTIVTLGVNQTNTAGTAANTTNFPQAINPTGHLCETLIYRITRNDPNDMANNCFVEGNIYFKDVTRPILTAPSRTVYSLGNTQQVLANALSYTYSDNCSTTPASFQIKKSNETDAMYRSIIDLTCADKDSMEIVLKAMDQCGNNNCVTVKLFFQDKVPPMYLGTAIPDSTVQCPVIKDPAIYGKPVFSEPCNGYTLTSTIVQDSTTNCGTGFFVIEYVATDSKGNKSMPVRRRFNVVNPKPFDPATIKCPTAALSYTNTYTDPSQLPVTVTGEPTYKNEGCDLVVKNLKENIFRSSNTSCSFKIMRVWEIANCCIPSGTGSLMNPYTCTQTITVMDNIPPKLSNLAKDTMVTTDKDCLLSEITLKRPTATDCANKAVFGVSSYSVSIVPMPAGATQDANNPFKFYNLPTGVYTVGYTVRDESNVAAFHTYKLTVKDITGPKLVAHSSLSTTLNASGTAMINLANYVISTSDNCPGAITTSFSPTSIVTMLNVDCNNVCNGNNGNNTISIYAKDAEGNITEVKVNLTVQKGTANCNCLTGGGTGSKPVAGGIQTYQGVNVEEATVNLTQNGVTTSTITGADGAFSINAIDNNEYSVAPQKNDDVLNGVTTFDLVLISKHILGTSKFTSPYQYIAADIDRSGKVSIGDVVQLRKTILGLIPAFPQNNSWRFIDKSYVFADENNPLEARLPEEKTGKTPTTANDFVAIKIGDINSSAKANHAQRPSGTRGALTTMEFMVDDKAFKAGEEFTIPVSVKDFADIIAYQFTMKFGKDKLEVLEVKSSDNGADCEFGLTHLQEGMATTSWMNVMQKPMSKGEVVFTIRFKAKENGLLSECLSITSDLTRAEAYNDAGEIADVVLHTSKAVLANNDNVVTDMIQHLQNQPNPFNESTTIRFVLKESTQATLRIFDQTGRIVKAIEGNYNQGANTIEVNDLPSGLMLYRLETATGVSATRRMLKM